MLLYLPPSFAFLKVLMHLNLIRSYSKVFGNLPCLLLLHKIRIRCSVVQLTHPSFWG